ncbi:MAG: InlB B-repeat-containing protein, partial [Candidatus Methanomethylophilaceae archaeon]|nr:InlB B-repeat-containing protein [Candidatus Methanomethylophilaceae archaeon]
YAFTNNDSKATDVTYNDNEGTISKSEITFTSTNEIVQACMFTNGNYVFGNWNTKMDGTDTTYVNG